MSSTPTAIHPSQRLRARELPRAASPALLLALAATLACPSGTALAQAATSTGSQCPTGWAPVPTGVNPALRCLPQSLIASLPRQPTPSAPPAGCPSGWRPVSPALNPVLRCQPDRLAAGHAPRPAKPVGCPVGWTTVPPSVNPLLRCLPNDIAALAPRQKSVAPAGCPTGWKPVEPGIDPVMRCLPGSIGVPSPEPLQGGPGTGDPGQGRDTPTAQAISRDLALVDTFRIGPVAMAWGTSASLPASGAAFRKDGACGFRFLHRTRNQGIADTQDTFNRIHRDTQAGPVLATRPLPALAAGAVAMSDGHISLKPGTWLLYIHADAPDLVAETDEANNLRRVRVTVTGSCAG